MRSRLNSNNIILMLSHATKTFIAHLVIGGRFSSAKKLHRALILSWELWSEGIQEEAIPGFEVCPPDAGKGYPRGMSYYSINKIFRSLILEHGTASRATTTPLP